MDEKEKQKNKQLTAKDIMSDRKYRSRAILAFYAILFLVLIIMIRVDGSPTKNNNKKDNSNPKTEKPGDNKKEDMFDGFDLIASKSFEYIYILTINDDVFVSTGKKYNDKEMFTLVVNKKDKIEYLVEKETIKGKEVIAKDKDAYVSMKKPIVELDYFDTDILNKILNKTEKISNNELFITNKNLCSILKCSTKDDTLTNKIELDIKNNYIIEIKIDYFSLISTLNTKLPVPDEIKKAFISLSYKNFNLVEDFDIKYE